MEAGPVIEGEVTTGPARTTYPAPRPKMPHVRNFLHLDAELASRFGGRVEIGHALGDGVAEDPEEPAAGTQRVP